MQPQGWYFMPIWGEFNHNLLADCLLTYFTVYEADYYDHQLRLSHFLFHCIRYANLLSISHQQPLTPHHKLVLSSLGNRRPLSEILQELNAVMTTNEITHINVRRSEMWRDTCRLIRKKRFCPSAQISVKFADDDGRSEGAVDIGGPRREFLRLLVKAINSDSGIFVGPENCRSLFPNASGRCGHVGTCRQKEGLGPIQ